MNATFLMTTLLACAAGLTAQTELRGKVEDVPNTQNQFFLGCTSIPLVSTAVNLNNWIGLDSLMQVTDIGAPGAPILRVDAIAATAETFEMGNLRFNQARNWTVFAPNGSFTLSAVNFTANTSFFPVAGLGTYLLGNGAITVGAGFAGANNQFQFQFTMPNAPAFTGVSMTGQALILEQANFYFSNPDCKEIGV